MRKRKVVIDFKAAHALARKELPGIKPQRVAITALEMMTEYMKSGGSYDDLAVKISGICLASLEYFEPGMPVGSYAGPADMLSGIVVVLLQIERKFLYAPAIATAAVKAANVNAAHFNRNFKRLLGEMKQ